MSDRSFPAAQAHGPITEVFPDIFFVTGAVKLGGPVRISRNMTVVREDGRLVVISSMRLSEEGHAELDRLGKVTDVIRVAGFHGMDDPYYKERYGAKVWVVEGQSYRRGFDYAKQPKPTYFEPDATLRAGDELPLRGASLYAFSTKPSEGLVRLDREGGILVAGDALQNWATPDRYFSLPGKLVCRAMGFIKPHNVGPGWLRGTRPDGEELRGVLDLAFDHVLPVHGTPVKGGAREAYRAAIERAARR